MESETSVMQELGEQPHASRTSMTSMMQELRSTMISQTKELAEQWEAGQEHAEYSDAGGEDAVAGGEDADENTPTPASIASVVPVHND